MILLAFETSCDETSVALIQEGQTRSSAVASQTALHTQYGGVVPELATREHLKNLLPLALAVLKAAECRPADLDAIAVTQGPGLPNALMTGFKFAQAAAYALGKPLMAIHHHEAHLFSPWISGEPPRSRFEEFEPNVSLIVSGGHTLLVHVDANERHRVLGSTVDDAAGECFDKIAKLIGLPYPGGPELDNLAAQGNPKAHNFPRPMMHDASDDFSFSGLKTAVRYFLQKHPETLSTPAGRSDLCASAQAAIVDVLIHKTLQAALREGVRCVTASGGVTCNRSLRNELTARCKHHNLRVRLADRNLCTDNAIMIGILAERKLQRHATPCPIDAEVRPSWELD